VHIFTFTTSKFAHESMIFFKLLLSRNPDAKKWKAVNSVKDSGDKLMGFLDQNLLPAI
jgi:hypothetical protein